MAHERTIGDYNIGDLVLIVKGAREHNGTIGRIVHFGAGTGCFIAPEDTGSGDQPDFIFAHLHHLRHCSAEHMCLCNETD